MTLDMVELDDALVSFAGASCNDADGILAPNATATCDAVYTLTQANIDAGSISNTATAYGNPPSGNPDSRGDDVKDSDGTRTLIPQVPALNVVKSSTTTVVDHANQVVPYRFEVSNVGNVTLTSITVTDPKCDVAPLYASGDDNSDGKLDLAEIWVYTCSHKVMQAEIDGAMDANLQLSNTVTADSKESDQATDDHNIPITYNPALDVVKSSTTKAVDHAGQWVPYSYLITNIGNTTLTGVTLTDNNVDAAPVCELVAAGGDFAAAPVGRTGIGFVYLPAVAIGSSGVAAALAAADAVAEGAVSSAQDGLTLAPGQSASCTAQHTVTQAEMDTGKVKNTATADSDQTVPDTADLSIPATQNPALSLDKTASPITYDAVGQTISYSYKLTNVGNVTLAGPFTVSDDKSTDESCPATQSLLPGASIVCTASYTIKQSDLDAGSVKNTAQGSVQFGGKSVLSNQDSETVTATQTPALTLTKSANPTIYSYPGQVIVYTYVLKNTGNVTLSGPFAISDDKLLSFQCGTATSLAPGASTSCTKNYTIQPGDLNATNNASITNKATATGKDPKGQTVTSNEATATILQQASTGQLAPTATTCQMFANGTAGNLTTLQYGVKGNAINNVAPGVMFYYSKITAPAASFPIQVTQSNNKSWKPMGIQDLGQVIVWDANCVKSNATAAYTSSNGTVSIQVNGATVGAVYYLSIKYNPGSLVGQKVSKPYPTTSYTFKTILNGAEIITSWDSVNVTPK